MTPQSTGWSASSRHNVPSDVSSFIGRRRDVAEIKRLLRESRLLTLTGVGGSGKTRLALRVAAEMVPAFPDGVWLTQLASLTDSLLVPSAVATALGIHGAAGQPLLSTLATALAPRRLLLVLDNCEHLIGAAARIAESLLGACPHLRILATSREPLRIPGETIWRVPPLSLRDERVAPPDSLTQVEAVALFLDRARARQPTFQLTAGNAPAVTTICRRLEGLPLAIELATAQLGALAPQQIAARLDDAVGLLGRSNRTVPRHETLRATLAWSYALLSEVEQALFRRLAVFAGSFDAEAPEVVGSGDGIECTTVLGLLTALVEKSLVEARVEGVDTRYRLLEPVRQYAAEQLAHRGETERVKRRHAEYFMELAERAEPQLHGGGRGPWMARLAAEQDNLRAALAWSRHARDPSGNDVGLRLAGALAFFWGIRGDAAEGYEWLETLLAREAETDPAARARALYSAGELGWAVGQIARARARAEEAAGIFRALGDTRRLAYTLQSLPLANNHPRSDESLAESLSLFAAQGDAWGTALAMGAVDIFALTRDGDPGGQGRARLEEALRRFRALRDDWGAAQMLTILGDLERREGDRVAAAARYEEALTLLSRQDLTGMMPSVLQNLGYLASHAGKTRRALGYLRESLGLFRDQGDQRGVADCLDGVAGVLALMRQPERAAHLLGAAQALRQSIGATVWPANVADHAQSMTLIRERLGDEGLAAALAAGRSLPLAEVMAGVLEAEMPPDLQRRTSGFDLTRREREVAALVAGGLTNRQIASELFITEETARLHVKHILGKLGFSSRTQVAAWAVKHDLAAGPHTR